MNYYLLFILESIFICGVDVFVLISGYFQSKSKRISLWKPISLTVQVMIFNIGIYVIQCLLDGVSISVKSALFSLLPRNYFLVLYCTVLVLSPYINLFVEKLSVESMKKLIVILIILFSAFPTLVDLLGEIKGEQINGLSTIGAYGSQWGYTFVNFLLMYLIGAYLNKAESDVKKWTTKTLIAIFALCIFVITSWSLLNEKVGYFKERSAWEYCNPFIVLTAIVVFILFTRIPLESKWLINKAAEGTFTVFLLHSVFLKYLYIEQFVNLNVFVMLAHILATSIGLYIICYLAHIIYHFIIDGLFRKVSARISLFVGIDV